MQTKKATLSGTFVGQLHFSNMFRNELLPHATKYFGITFCRFNFIPTPNMAC